MNTESARLRNWALACLVNLMWAAQYPAYKAAADVMTVAALNVWCFTIAILALLPAVLIERRRGNFCLPGRRQLWPILLIASLGLIPQSALLSWGIERSTASNASILALTIPVMMAGMGVLLLREKLHRFFPVSLVLALAGTVLISWRDLAGGSFAGALLIGNAAIFLSGAGSAFFNAYGKRLLDSMTGLEVLVYSYAVGVVLCVAMSLLTDAQPFYRVTQWPMQAWLGVIVLGSLSWGLAMVLWFRLLKRLELGQVAVSVYLLPVLGVALSAVTLGDRLSLMQYLGALLVLGSAYLNSAPSINR